VARPRPYLHRSPPLTSSGVLPTHLDDGQPLIRLQTLGASTILVGDQRINGSAGTLFCLLLRLTYSPGMLLGRDVLLTSLWPEQAEARQRANLRQALYKLRNTGVRASMHGDVVQLDPAQVLRTFSLDGSSETFARDVTLGHEPFGPFLPGFVVPWPEQQDWISEQRELMHAEIRRVLVEQLRQRRDRADWGGADPLARWLLQFDPLNEEATLTLADCAFLSGSKSTALGIIDRYLADLGPSAGDIRIPAMMLRRRIAEPPVRGRVSFAPTERHFVGREEELAALTLSMRRARWHDGSATLLHGTAGIGKSRLAHELEKVATIEGVTIARAACRESDTQRSLAVFLDVLPELLVMPGALGAAPESLSALRRLVPSERGPLGADGASERDPLPVAAQLRRSIIDLVAAIADEKPLLLVVDDVHWIDEHSWEVLSDLIDRADCLRVCVVLTSREPHARPTRPARVPMALRMMAVPSLTAEQCVRLSRAIGDDLSASVSDELGDWFVRASEGIPLFLRALVNHWIETGEAGGVPPTLQGVIEQRISQLHGDSLRVLQTAVILGRWATVDRVVRVLELRANEMLTCIEQIEALGASASRSGAILAVHELLGRAARARLSALSSRTLHKRAAEVLYADAMASGDTEILLSSLEAYYLAGEEEVVRGLTIANLDTIVAEGTRDRGLVAVRRLAQSDLTMVEQARLAGATAKLLLAAGEYRTALAEPLDGVSLPDVRDIESDEQADTSLSLVDSSYRADPLVDRSKLIAFASEIVETERFERSIRIRAADIGLILVSNECEQALADRLFNALQLSDGEIEREDACRKVAILYHTQFGERNRALAIANFLYKKALAGAVSTHTYHDAMRAGFALRIVDDSRCHLDAMMLSFDIAKEMKQNWHALSSAWHLSLAFLDLGEQMHLDMWMHRVRELFSEVGDSTTTNFVHSLLCRVAIEQGDRVSAGEHFATFSKNLPRFTTPRTDAYALCLSTALDLLDNSWTPSEDRILALQAQLDRVGSFGTADFNAAIAADALFRAGRAHAAGLLIANFMQFQRRESRRPSAILQRTLTRLEKTTG
jgi:DNA-binding SARP family transcriptional activator